MSLSEAFYIAIATTAAGIIAYSIKYLLKIKISDCSFCCINCKRDIDNEIIDHQINVNRHNRNSVSTNPTEESSQVS